MIIGWELGGGDIMSVVVSEEELSWLKDDELSVAGGEVEDRLDEVSSCEI